MKNARVTGGWQLPAVRTQRRVLLVEDSAVQRLHLRGLLETLGYQVEEAHDGAAARAAMERSHPDIVLMDWELPDAEGPDIVKEWSGNSKHRWVPVIMVTGHAEADRVRRALDSGALDFVGKPPKPVELAARIRNVLQLCDMRNQLKELAQRDGLTGLWNRRVVMDRLRCEVAGRDGATRTVSLVMFDVDHFKSVNDTHGHDMGDIVLKQVAAHLEKTLAHLGTVARFGGEEFLVLMPNVSATQALAAADKTRAAFHVLQWGRPETRLNIRVSAGVASVRVSAGDRPDDLLKRADLALYRAKEAGRDQIAMG